MVFIGFPHWRMNIEYWLQHNIGKTVVRGINQELLVSRETSQKLAEAQPAEGACSRREPGLEPGAALPLPPTGSQPEDKNEDNVRAWASRHTALGGGMSKKTVEETRRGRRGSGSSAAAMGPQPGPCCTSRLRLLAQPVGDMSHSHPLASRWIELKLKKPRFFPSG